MYEKAASQRDDGWDEPEFRTMGDEECEACELEYKAALLRLKYAIPELGICPDELVSGVHARNTMTRPCPCGDGCLPCGPWVAFWDESQGFCVCDEACEEMYDTDRAIQSADALRGGGARAYGVAAWSESDREDWEACSGPLVRS